MAAPTSKEIEILPKFRSMLADLNLDDFQKSDAQLLRWLRARDLHLKKSEEMFRNTMKWREEFGIDDSKNWKLPEIIMKELHYEVSGYTENNTPVFIFPFGQYDLKKLYDMGKKEEVKKFVINFFEQLVSESKERINPRTNFPSTQIMLLLDCDQYSYGQLSSIGAIGIILELAKIFDANYPEILELCFVVNAPKIFTILFNMVKPLLAPRTVEKISIYPANESKWQPIVFKSIPKGSLPPKFGGTAEASVINHRGERGLKYRKIDSLKDPNGEIGYIEMDDEINSIDIAAGLKKKLAFETTEPNTNISWTIKLEKHDIGFSLLNENSTEILPYKKTSEGDEKGTFVCEIPGIYYLCFDNSYSRLRGKSVKIQLKIKN